VENAVSPALSLLPFLAPRGPALRLGFPLASDDPRTLADSSFPFVLLSDADPVARLVAARIETDEGEPLAPLFVLVQKDRYRLASDALRPVTNPAVEEAFRRAFAAYCRQDAPAPARLLGGQVREGGAPVPFASLFFCKHRRLFFHPPCPRCGRALALCRDERLLAAARLPLYSASLERYLFCEACGGPPGGGFFAVEAPAGALPAVRDRASLVREWGGLAAGAPGTGFPCPACPERAACYGPGLAVLRRIAPFSFYPFHAAFCAPASACAPDFVALLSGIPADRLVEILAASGEAGRAACAAAAGRGGNGVLFRGGERRFLEVLYLKLSLLRELFACLPRGEQAARGADPAAALDRVWVTLGAGREAMPRYWNFSAALFDVGRFLGEDLPGAAAPGRGGLADFGLCWFEALVGGPGRDGAALRAALARALVAEPGSTPPPLPGARGGGGPFGPEGLLFPPERVPLSPAAEALWEEILAFGWNLFAAGAGGAALPARAGVEQGIDGLRTRVRDLLFAEGAPAGEAHPSAAAAAPQEDRAIAEALGAVLAEWEAAAASPPSAPPPDEEGFVVRTVLLKGRPAGEPAAAPPPAAGAGPDLLEKTVVLRPEAGAAARPASGTPPGEAAGVPAPPRPGAEEEIEKTVVLRPGPSAKPSGPAPGPPAPGAAEAAPAAEAAGPSADPLEKTVVLSPGQRPAARGGPAGQPPAPPAEKAGLPRPPAAGEPPCAPPAGRGDTALTGEAAEAPEGADLEKTVILRPPPGGAKRQGR